MAVAVLTKGLIGIALPGLVLVVYTARRARPRDLAPPPYRERRAADARDRRAVVRADLVAQPGVRAASSSSTSTGSGICRPVHRRDGAVVVFRAAARVRLPAVARADAAHGERGPRRARAARLPSGAAARRLGGGDLRLLQRLELEAARATSCRVSGAGDPRRAARSTGSTPQQWRAPARRRDRSLALLGCAASPFLDRLATVADAGPRRIARFATWLARGLRRRARRPRRRLARERRDPRRSIAVYALACFAAGRRSRCAATRCSGAAARAPSRRRAIKPPSTSRRRSTGCACSTTRCRSTCARTPIIVDVAGRARIRPRPGARKMAADTRRLRRRMDLRTARALALMSHADLRRRCARAHLPMTPVAEDDRRVVVANFANPRRPADEPDRLSCSSSPACCSTPAPSCC